MEEELAFFETCRPRLLAEHKGNYALLKGSSLLGVYDTADEACEAGWAKLGHVPFLVLPITEPATSQGELVSTLADACDIAYGLAQLVEFIATFGPNQPDDPPDW